MTSSATTATLLIISVAMLLLLSVFTYAGHLAVGASNVPPLLAIGGIFAIILLVSAYLMIEIRHISIVLIILGIALLLIGTDIWLYGDLYNIVAYELGGVIVLLVGNITWILGDYMGGAFDERIAALMETKKGSEMFAQRTTQKKA